EPRETVHYNLIIAPDLSNRIVETLYPKPVPDINIIQTVYDNVYPRILTSKNRLSNQSDIFRIDLINRTLLTRYQVNADALSIDFSTFAGRQKERIEYLNGKNAERTFQNDKDQLLKEVSKIYKAAANETFGADVWSYLNNGYH